MDIFQDKHKPVFIALGKVNERQQNVEISVGSAFFSTTLSDDILMPNYRVVAVGCLAVFAIDGNGTVNPYRKPINKLTFGFGERRTVGIEVDNVFGAVSAENFLWLTVLRYFKYDLGKNKHTLLLGGVIVVANVVDTYFAVDRVELVYVGKQFGDGIDRVVIFFNQQLHYFDNPLVFMPSAFAKLPIFCSSLAPKLQ